MSTNFNHGIKSYGIPIFGDGARFSSPWNTHYFVDDDNGSDSNEGTEPTKAFKTIQKAITASVGGDVIYIRPKGYKNGTGFGRYTEDVVVSQGSQVAADIDTMANKSIIGITQRGCSTDFLGVRWTFASATPLTNNTPAFHIENVGFFVEAATYAINLVNNAPTTYGGTGVSIYNCAIKGDGAIYAGYGCDELQIIHCRFQSKYDGTTGGINLVGSVGQCKRPIIRGCEFIGGNANNMATPPINGAAPWYDAIIRDCYFNAETDTGVYINISGINTGMVANCYFGSADITTTSIVASGMLGVGCYDDDGIQAAPIA